MRSSCISSKWSCLTFAEAPVTPENLQEMLQELQALGDPKDVRIAIISLRLAQEYDARGENPSTTLKLGEQALAIFEASGSYVTEVGMCYHLIASSCHKMGQHDQSLENLNKALKLLEDKNAKDSAPVKFAVQFLLGDTLAALGKHEDALQHYVRGLAVQETILEAGHPQLAANYRQVRVLLVTHTQCCFETCCTLHPYLWYMTSELSLATWG